jgi:hypothetical protein
MVDDCQGIRFLAAIDAHEDFAIRAVFIPCEVKRNNLPSFGAFHVKIHRSILQSYFASRGLEFAIPTIE